MNDLIGALAGVDFVDQGLQFGGFIYACPRRHADGHRFLSDDAAERDHQQQYNYECSKAEAFHRFVLSH